MIIEVKIVLNFIVWKLFDTNPCSQLLKIIDCNFYWYWNYCLKMSSHIIIPVKRICTQITFLFKMNSSNMPLHILLPLKHIHMNITFLFKMNSSTLPFHIFPSLKWFRTNITFLFKTNSVPTHIFLTLKQISTNITFLFQNEFSKHIYLYLPSFKMN